MCRSPQDAPGSKHPTPILHPFGAMKGFAQGAEGALPWMNGRFPPSNEVSMSDPSPWRGDSIRTPSRVEERQLVREVKAGKEDALGRLLWIHWRGLVQYVLPVVRSQDQAEDVVQETFVRLWEKRTDWKRTETLRPVLYRIARNLALNERRRHRTFLDRVTGREPPRELDPRADPLAEAVGSDLEEAVREAVDALPERRREIFILVRFHSMTYREAAETLDVSPQTVANQVSLATRDLREALSDRIGESDGDGDLRLFGSGGG